MLQQLWKTIRKFLKILKIELAYDLVIQLLGKYPEELKICSRKSMYMNVHRIIILNS